MKRQSYQKAITDVEEMKCECTKMRDTMAHDFLQCHKHVSLNQHDKEAKLTAKYSQSVVKTLSFCHIITVGLLFRCDAEKSKSFSILFGQCVYLWGPL